MGLKASGEKALRRQIEELKDVMQRMVEEAAHSQALGEPWSRPNLLAKAKELLGNPANIPDVAATRSTLE